MENIERRNSIKNEEIDGALVENELTDVIPIEELEEEFFSDCEPGPSSRIFIKSIFA